MMRMRTLAIALLIGLTVGPSNAAGGAPKKSTPLQLSPRQQALEHFNKGLKHRDKAWKHEKKAAAASKQKDRDKNLAKARKEYGKAIERQLSATMTDPHFHEVFSRLGYAYRKTGEYALGGRKTDDAGSRDRRRADRGCGEVDCGQAGGGPCG